MTKSSSEFFKSSSIQSSDERNKISEFYIAILEHKKNAQIWEGLTCAKRLCDADTLVQSLQKASLAAVPTCGRF